MTKDEGLSVTQADRDAAADTLSHVDGEPFVAHIRDGMEDDSYLVQAFARHRLAHSTPSSADNALMEAAKDVVDRAFDHYRARNGRMCSIEGDDGEKCWIVPFDAMEDLRAALASSPASEAEPVGYQIRCLLPTGNHQWRYPVLPSELSCIKEFGTDEAGIPYAVRPLYAAPVSPTPASVAGEPAAWMYESSGHIEIYREPNEYLKRMTLPCSVQRKWTETPLYATPPAQGEEGK